MSSQSFPFSRLSQLRRAREISLAVAEPLVYSILLLQIKGNTIYLTRTQDSQFALLMQRTSLAYPNPTPNFCEPSFPTFVTRS
ncbi:hypothetical protein G7K_1114-t1 [Saitoella complicata NRRL Y-17804]|uniref:Uncharacterized protein n=1 Tax=Saitoella complicata (strain BCRC 22490 / CBS 7301 / JCM 7358 / NBRC 10748 / NRRL Y-17804) TaxID=698492 RepID=A0A0E9NB28_SAICN|nr:hypothetical protein G7K_1114-t1 [Saitoella complicata NRRL Y-17804]